MNLGGILFCLTANFLSLTPRPSHFFGMKAMTNEQQKQFDAERLISRKDAAALVGLALRTIDLKTRTGDFPSRIVIGRSVFFRYAEILAWIESHRVVA